MPCPSSGAQPGTGADAQQPPLVPRCGSCARLTASVRLLTFMHSTKTDI